MNVLTAFSMNEMVTTGVTNLITDATSMVSDNALPILGVMGIFASVNIGFRVFKRFTSKVG